MTTQTRIIQGDVVRFCKHHKTLGLPKFHALLCDAPYGLSFMGKDWDSIDGVAFDPETWRAIADTLLPGAYLMVFAGNLNDDLISVAMRRAGLVKQHKALAWSQGSSLPKTTRIDTQLDDHGGASVGWFGPWLREYRNEHGIKQKELAKHFPSKTGGLTGCVANWELGLNMPTVDQFNKLVDVLDLPFETLQEAEREVVGKSRWTNSAHHFVPGADHTERVHLDITAPATELARTWAGHRYGSQALRNLVEAILIFRKPYEGRPVDSIVRYGSGTYNIEGSRIAGEYPSVPQPAFNSPTGKTYNFKTGEGRNGEMSDNTKGRHPSNFHIQHSPECVRRGTKRVRGTSDPRRADGTGNASWGTSGIYGSSSGEESKGMDKPRYADADGLESVADWKCVPECVVRLLDEQAGELKTGAWDGKRNTSPAGIYELGFGKVDEAPREASTGGPSRFLHNSDWSHEQHYAAETGHAIEDANAVRYQAKPSKAERDAGLLGHFPCVICGEYNTATHTVTEGDKQVTRPCRRSIHPTRKPIELMKYLSTLLSVPDTYAPRRLFVPFCGEGSEVSGAILSGAWEEIVGVDSEPAFVDRARRAVAYWQDEIQYGQNNPATILKTSRRPAENKAGDVQLSMFDIKKTS